MHGSSPNAAPNPALLERVRQLLVADATSSAALDRNAFVADDEQALLPPAQVGIYRLADADRRRRNGLGVSRPALRWAFRADRRHQVHPAAAGSRHRWSMPNASCSRAWSIRASRASSMAGLTENGLHFLVMEYVSGRALDQYANEQKLGARERIELLREACAAVAHAHQNLVVHCDIKPANILGDGRRPARSSSISAWRASRTRSTRGRRDSRALTRARSGWPGRRPW